MPSTTQTPIAPVLTFLSEIEVSGNLSIVTKGPIDHLSALDLLEIEEAQELHRAGLIKEAAARILKIERRLGVTDEDRFAAARGEPWEGSLEAAIQSLAPPEEAGPDRMPAPRDHTRFNEAEAVQIDRYDQIRTIAKVRGNKKGVSQAEGALARIAHQREHRIDVKERHDGIQETIALAKGRGEEVDEKPPTGGAAHMISRDALAHMKKLGHITGAQFAAGMAYRQAFEARGSDLQASQISDTGGGKGHDNDAFVHRKMEQAKASEFAKVCEVAVRKYTMVEHLSALQMLQWVAGTGRSMRDFGAGGRAYERNRKALAAALDLIAGMTAAAKGSEKPAQTSMAG